MAMVSYKVIFLHFSNTTHKNKAEPYFKIILSHQGKRILLLASKIPFETL